METKPLSITDHTMIVVRTHADLNLQGWDKQEIKALADDRNSLNIDQEGDLIRVQSNSDLDLMVPEGVPVTVERASGDVYVRNLHGALQMMRVGGELSLQSTGAVNIQAVSGDCQMISVLGPLVIQRVGGDFTGYDLAGPVRVDSAGGDVNLQVSSGEVQARAGGDLICMLQSEQALPMRLHAGGDALVILPEEAAFALDLRANGHGIHIEYGGQSLEIDKRFYQAVFGEGGAPISVDAGGDIHITSDEGEFDQGDLAENMKSHWQDVEESREERSEEAEQAFTLRAEELSAHINHRVNDAMRQADARIQEAMKRLEQRTRRLERNFVPPTPPVPPVPPGRPMPPRRATAAAATEKKADVNDD